MATKYNIELLYSLLQKAITIEYDPDKVFQEKFDKLLPIPGIKKIVEDNNFKETFNQFRHFKPGIFFRHFQLIEALLSAEEIRKIFYNSDNGGLQDGYILYVKKSINEYTQLHHFNRLGTLLFPPFDADFYFHALRLICSRDLRTNPNYKMLDCLDKSADIPNKNNDAFTRAINSLTQADGEKSDLTISLIGKDDNSIELGTLLKKLFDHIKNFKEKRIPDISAKERLLAREIVDEYILQQRLDLVNQYRKETDRGIENIPFARELVRQLGQRSEFERTNHIILVSEGELLFGIILQRWAEIFWVLNEGCYQLKKVDRILSELFLKNEENPKDLSEWAGATNRHKIGILEKVGRKYRFSNAFLIVLEFLAAQSRSHSPIKFQLNSFFSQGGAKHGAINSKIDSIFSLAIDLIKLSQSKGTNNQEALISGALHFFKTLFSSNQGLPFNDYQLSQNLHFDAFVANAFMARYEERMNEEPTIIRRTHRYFYAFPIDPISSGRSADQEEHTKQDVFALWVGFLEQADELGGKKIDHRIVRMKNFLNLLGQPIVRERIEHDLNLETQKVRESAIQAARSAIMARNMSHNIGSHVLAALNTAQYNISLLRVFNTYIQERMDFIAGVTSGWAGVPEEMWFFKDIIYNFLNNIPLLDLITSSHGFNKSNIKFIFNNTWYAVYDITERKYLWHRIGIKETAEEDDAPDDFLVAIPRGMVGRHAFYTIIENIIRNSAKYGAAKKPGVWLELNIDYEILDNVYKISICDNLSPRIFKDKEEKINNLAEQINAKIIQDILSADNAPNYRNMGIIEMKTAAELLANPHDKRFPAFEHCGKIFHLWADNDAPQLTYKFYLQLPNLLLLVSSQNHGLSAPCGFRLGSSISALSDDNQSYRLSLISTKHIKQVQSHQSQSLPYRYQIIAQEHQITAASNTLENWQDLFFSQYCEWIRQKFTLDKNAKYSLVISFERGTDGERWSNVKLDPRLGNLMELYVISCLSGSHSPRKLLYSSNKEIQDISQFIRFLAVERNLKLVVYDNHENFSGYLKRNDYLSKLLHLHHMGVSGDLGHLKIFNSLCYPPADGFTLNMQVLYLLESAITKIVILDERIAENLCERMARNGYNNAFYEDSYKYFSEYLGIIVPFYIKLADSGEKIFYSEKIREHYATIIDQSQKWGIRVTKEGFAIETEENTIDYIPDLFVIHQGIIDEHIQPRILDNNVFQGFFKSSIKGTKTYTVITSGRGRHIKHITDKDDLPFIEFSALKACLMDDVSKLDLVKALSFCKGGIIKKIEG